MTREFFRSRPLGKLFRSVGILAASKRLVEPFLVRRVLELLQSKRMVVIFPEAGARWDGKPLPWMSSTVKLFVRAGVPIHPIRIHGSYAAFPRWADYPRPSRVAIQALPPITFDRDTDVVEAQALLQSLTNFDENTMRPDCRPTRAFRPAAGIHRLLYRDPWNDSGPLFSADGQTVKSPAGNRSFKMLPDSRLIDARDASIVSAADLYAQIRAMPLPRTPTGGILDDYVKVYTETTFPVLVDIGQQRVQLFNDRIALGSGSRAQTISLEDIVYCDIERNFKLQLYLRNNTEHMMQFSFVGSGSALQWKDTLSILRPELVGLDAPQSSNGNSVAGASSNSDRDVNQRSDV